MSKLLFDPLDKELYRLEQGKQPTQWILSAGGLSIHFEATIKRSGDVPSRFVSFAKIKRLSVYFDDEIIMAACENMHENARQLVGAAGRVGFFGEKPVLKDQKII